MNNTKNSTKNHTLFPWLLVLYEIAIYLSMDAYAPAFPQIAHDFSVSSHLVVMTATLWMFGGLSVQLIIGPLSDRYGRRPILLWGGALFITSTIVCALAHNIDLLLVARFFQGMAVPTMYITGYAAVNESYDSNTAIKILAKLVSVTVLAPAFGPLLGAVILLYFSWHDIFAFLAVWSFVILAMLYRFMPETLTKDKQAARLHLGDIASSYKMVLKNFRFITYGISSFFPIIGLIAWMLAGPLIVVNVFHRSVLEYGMIQGAVFVFYILGSQLVNRYSNEQRNERITHLGLALSLGGSILACISSYYFPHHLYPFVLCLMVILLGCGLSCPILSRLMLDASQAPMGIRVTMLSLIRMASGFIGAYCVAVFYDGSLFSIAAVMIVFTAVAVAMKRTAHVLQVKKT